jgi:hypothetical protein
MRKPKKLIGGVKVVLIPPPKKGRISTKVIRAAVQKVRDERPAAVR